MNKAQRTVTTALWGALVLAMVGVISAGLFRPHDPAPVAEAHADPVVFDFDAPAFSLTDQDGHTVTNASLKGNVWIADFIFTHCAGPCPEMSKKFERLQQQIPDKDVKFISFSVDPETDTPAVLKDYGIQYGAQADRWSLLTGDKTVVYGVAKGIMLPIMPGTENTPLEHSQRFIVVDAAGKVRGIFASDEAPEMQEMIAKVKALAADARKSAGR